ncbi:unnamed protein product, partial [Rotaria socialis]
MCWDDLIAKNPASKIAALVQVSQPTVVDWLNFLREVWQEAFNDATQMGGVGKIVQIGESLFRDKRKYNRGRLLLGSLNKNNNNNVNVQNSSSSSDSEYDDYNNTAQRTNNRNYGRRVEEPWIFGIVEPTEEGQEKHVYLGTTIWPDQWKVYSRLQTGYGYDHETVNHSRNFVDLRTGYQTQLIE